MASQQSTSPGQPEPSHQSTQTLKAVVLLVVALVLGSIVLGKTGASGLGKGTPAPVPNTVVLDNSLASSTTNAPPTTRAHVSAPTSATDKTRGSSSKKGTTTTTLAVVPPGQVTLLVANGTSVSGAAGRVSSELVSLGYQSPKVANASTLVSSTTIYYAPGFQGNAQAVATFLNVSGSVEPISSSAPVTSIQGIDVLVVVGPTLASSTTS